MRNYTELHITYVKGELHGIAATLPKRARRSGGVRGCNNSNSYSFEPPLTKEEIVGLTSRLVDLDVKKFTFEDTCSLGTAD
jgi:hypothetical protein